MRKTATCLLVSTLLTGCSSLGIKSVPWFTSTTVHNSAAVDFLRGAPPVDANLGEGLKLKPMASDGRLVGMSISGGGARAAAFTLGVLAELQTLETSDGSNALERLDFLSSNSGGGWAVAAYLADRAARRTSAYSLQSRRPDLIRAFVRTSEGTVRCWSRAMRTGVIGGATYRDVYSPASAAPLPRAFFNASLLPANAPFVFTDAFIRHYQVEQFGACGNDPQPAVTRVADLPISYAAAASGTVPSFYYAYATTRLCDPSSPSSAASFCRSGQSMLRLADGGLYDNIGYKTAFEVMRSEAVAGAPSRRAMLLVNSGTSTDDKTVQASKANNSFLFKTATNGVFAVQDATFERLYRPMFGSLGVEDPVLLDFYSTARFRPEQVKLLDGLDTLAFYAAHNVLCYSASGSLPLKKKVFPIDLPPATKSLADLGQKGGDCLSENFYRAGTLGKTTYLADGPMFTVHWELGQLAVRMNRERILRAVDGS